MEERLSTVLQRYRAAPQRFTELERWSLLVWLKAPVSVQRPLIWGTVRDYPREPAANDPLLFRLRKDDTKRSNAFGVGVTLGRATNNDLVVDQASISRFHAFFQEDPKTHVWHVVDAQSANGTFLGDGQLIPNRPAPLHDHAQLRFGDVDLRFFSPTAFEEFVRRQLPRV